MKVVIQETLYNNDENTGQIISMVVVTTKGDTAVDRLEDVAITHREAMEKLLKEDK